MGNILKRIYVSILFTSFCILVSNSANAQPNNISAEFTKPLEGSVFLNIIPKVTLFELTAAGTQDPKADWSNNARSNLEAAIKNYFDKYKLKYSTAGDYSQFSNEAIQYLKLHEAVIASISMNNNLMYKLPTKPIFDWSMGEGAKVIGVNFFESKEIGPDYALFIEVEGIYSSSGRKAMMVTAAMLGVGIPSGVQMMRSSILELKTGKILWYHEQILGLTTDPRNQEGANSAIEKIFKQLPIKSK